MANQLRSHYDIVINGGGIVGFTLLNSILKSPYLKAANVLLIERSQKPANTEKFRQHPRLSDSGQAIFSNRVSSITYASKSAFKKLGVWNLVKPYAKDVRRIQVWNYDYTHKIVFNQDLSSCQSDKEERDIVFSTVENDRLSTALLESIHNCNNPSEKIAWSSELLKMEESLENGLIDITLKSSNSEDVNIKASLVLGCDGYSSKVRELTGMTYRERDLKKMAIVGTVKMNSQSMKSENDIAYQRFSSEKDTVAALLPLDNNFSSFVISAPTEYAKHLKYLEDEMFIEEFNRLLSSAENPTNPVMRGLHDIANKSCDNLRSLAQVLGPRFGLTVDRFNLYSGFQEVPNIESVLPDSRATFPLIFGSTSPRMIASLPGLNRPQVALLGDASHRVHPLAGQGLNLGIQDAVELVKQLEQLAKSGERVFNDTSLLSKALRRYEFKRQAYILPMSASILAMQDVFKLTPSRLLSSVDRCQPMKRASVRVANGI